MIFEYCMTFIIVRDKNVLYSVPFLGDSQLYVSETIVYIIKRTRSIP